MAGKRAATPSRTAGRARERRKARSQRRPWWQSPMALGGGAVTIVVIAIVVIVVLTQAGGQSPGNTTTRPPVPVAVVDAVTRPNASVLAQIGTGGQPGNLAKLPGPQLTDSAGKPLVVYVGGEYCPFCAAERWVIVAALARFGTFSGLQEMTSAATDVYPNTSTFTFINASYSSTSVGFESSEVEDRNQQPLQSPSAQVANVFSTFDRPPYTSTTGGFPFLDIAGRYTLSSTSYSPQLLQGLSWTQIASQLQDPSSQVAQAIWGNANILTAAICSATGNQPESVCSAPYIQSIETSLPH